MRSLVFKPEVVAPYILGQREYKLYDIVYKIIGARKKRKLNRSMGTKVISL